MFHAVLGAIAHLWWYAAVERVGPSRAAIFLNVTPLVGMAMAAVLLAEPIGRWQIAGVLLVLAGGAPTTRLSRPPPPRGGIGGAPPPPPSSNRRPPPPPPPPLTRSSSTPPTHYPSTSAAPL